MKHFDLFIKRAFLGTVFAFLAIFSFAVVQNRYQVFKDLTNKQLAALTTEVPTHFVLNDSVTPAAAPIDNVPQARSVVLGTQDSFSFTGASNYGSNGGVIVLNAQNLAQVYGSYQVSGPGKFTLYKATKSDLLNYLLYRRTESSSWGSSIQKIYRFDTAAVPVEQSFEQQVTYDSNRSRSNPINLPIEGKGIWFLRGEINGAVAETMIIRTDLGAIIHEADNSNVFWVQDQNYASVPEASIELFNSNDQVTTLQQLQTNTEGIATSPVNEALDFAVVTKGDDLTLIPVHLNNLNYRYGGASSFSSFSPRVADTKSFSFTDRFLYKPGDTIHFKAIIRKDDDADYSIEGKTYQVSFGVFDSPFWQKNVQVSALGTIDADIQVPEDAEAGYYELTIKDGDSYIVSSGVQVANFRKPDATISVTTDKMQYLPGEKVQLDFSGTAFLGQPLRNTDLRYKVYQYKAYLPGEYSEITYLPEDPYFSKDVKITEGKVTLDKKGRASATITAANTTGYRQYWVIETEYLDAASNTANSAVRTLIQPGDFVIDNGDTNRQFVVDTEVTYPFKLNKNKVDADISGIPVTASVIRSVSDSEVTVASNLAATSDANGNFEIKFTPDTADSYTIKVEAKDKSGNTILGQASFGISAYAHAQQKNIFTITTDKETYNIGDTARVTIKTEPSIKNIFVSVGRNYSRDYRVLPVSNGAANFDFTVPEKYQPNVFVYTGSFQTDNWDSDTKKVLVNTSDKEVSVTITPTQQSYGPGETAQFAVVAKDGNGNPVQTDLAFWVFDKALLELHGTYFDGIFKAFWDERWFSISTKFSYQGITSNGAEGGGGCFSGDTLITMADGSYKRIDQVAEGDLIKTFSSSNAQKLVNAKVSGTHKVTVGGYLILNGELKVTPEHILYVNGNWITAGDISVGDKLVKDDGSVVTVSSIEWLKGKFDVYNLKVDNYHTFFANDIYVHNDKGDVRSTFKDTAYWNPHVTTGADGTASVTFTLPDNLTTWVAAAVAANEKTQVGKGTAEFIVTKDFVVRPIYPAFLRTGDDITLSALLSNFTKDKDSFAVTAKLTGGEINNASQNVAINSEDIEELQFPVKVTGANEDAVYTVRAEGQKNKNLVDEVTEKLPIFEYGSWIQHFEKAENEATLPIQISQGTDQSRATAMLELSANQYPALATTLLTMVSKDYSYTTENSASTLIAASILKQHGKELGISFDQSAVNQQVSNALQILAAEQKNHGIWVIPGGQDFDAHTTLYVMEALEQAQAAGYAVDQNMIDTALGYLKQQSSSAPETMVTQQYVYSLFPTKQLSRQKIDVSTLTNPELVAKAVIANKRQGFSTDADIERLNTFAHKTDTQLSWKASSRNRDSYRYMVDMGTVWGVYAAQTVQAADLDVQNGLDYLYRNEPFNTQVQGILNLVTLQYLQSSDQLSPNYQYTVTLGQDTLAQGSVTSLQQVIQPVEVPTGANGSLTISTSGNGRLFSQLTNREFFVDKSKSAESHDLSITRKYLATKGDGKPTEVGDLVIVQFKVAGFGLGEENVEIEDYLPSGLVAVDESLNNGNFDANAPTTSPVKQHITDQGMQLTFPVESASGTFSYKARVVSQGVFNTPPAVVRLKNDPSIWASSDAITLKIDGKSVLESLHLGNSPTAVLGSMSLLEKVASVVLALGIIAVVMAYLYKDTIVAFIQKRRNGPPTPPPVEQPPTQTPQQPLS